jgi:hypothetical protein
MALQQKLLYYSQHNIWKQLKNGLFLLAANFFINPNFPEQEFIII